MKIWENVINWIREKLKNSFFWSKKWMIINEWIIQNQQNEISNNIPDFLKSTDFTKNIQKIENTN